MSAASEQLRIDDSNGDLLLEGRFPPGSTFKTMVALAVGSWAGAFTLPAHAQSQPAARSADSGEIQSVTVTANRRAEDQQKVSVSVTAVTGETLYRYTSSRWLNLPRKLRHDTMHAFDPLLEAAIKYVSGEVKLFTFTAARDELQRKLITVRSLAMREETVSSPVQRREDEYTALFVQMQQERAARLKQLVRDLLDAAPNGDSPLVKRDRIMAWEKAHRALGAGGPVRGRCNSRDSSPALRPLLYQGAARPRLCGLPGTLHPAVESGNGAHERLGNEQVARQSRNPERTVGRSRR